MRPNGLILFVALILAGCLKDDVVLEELVTNPFDPDYTGPAVYEIDSVKTIQVGVAPPYTYNLAVYVRVRDELFPNPADYDVRIRDLENGTLEEIINNQNTHWFGHVKYNVDLGTEYCFEYNLRVQFSDTRIDEFCFTAQ